VTVEPAKRSIQPDFMLRTQSHVPPASKNDDGPSTQVLRKIGTGPNPGRNGWDWPRVRGYELLSVVGAGGMGIVYKARDRNLRRTVALKTIRTSAVPEPEFLARFHAEAEAVARLQHPNIIQVFEFGTVQAEPGDLHPSPYLALEYVDGGCLSQRVQSPQAPRDAALLVEKLARAVHAAHRLGVIHRDLKPANVLLTRDGEPKIADFGLAKQMEAERDAAGRFVTQAGVIRGTPDYMAPEQAGGAIPTPAVDIYALGVILYELLTARVPFHAATALETIDLVLRQPPAPPRRLRPQLPRDLDTICLKCLEKEPQKRYTSAEALADDLARFLDGRPIQARRVGPVERSARWAQRNPLPAALAVAVVLVGLLGLTGVLLQWREALVHASAADLATAEARDHARAERWERYRADIAAGASALQVYDVGSARRTLEDAPVEFRNWEWRHFHSRLDRAQYVLPVFEGPADDGLLSADGRSVALLSERAVRVWNTLERRELMAFRSTDAAFAHLHLSPDGHTLAYRTIDREVVLRDVDTNRVRAVLRGHEGTVHGLGFTDSGERLITGTDQGLRVWDVRTGALVRAIGAEGGRRVCICFSADGKRMTYTTPGETALRVLDVDTGRQLTTLSRGAVSTQADRESELYSAAFAERGRRILTAQAYPSSTMRLWEAGTGRLISVMRGHTNSVTHTAFSPDDTRIASSSMDQTVRVWDAAAGRLVATLRGHRGLVNWVSFSPSGQHLVSASDDHTVRLWDAATGEAIAVLHGHTGKVFRVTYTADGGTIVSASQDGTVRLWDARTAETDGVLRGHTAFVYGVAFHPGGQRVASASWDGTARIWDATTGRQLALLNHGERAIVTAVAFHPEGTILASRSRGAVHLWDVASGREIHRWNAPSDGWRDTRLAFNRRGDRLATACSGAVIYLWDVQSRAEPVVLRGHRDEIRDQVFSPDGRWLASAAYAADPEIRIWDVERGCVVHALAGHTAGAYALAFNREGTLLASGSTDGTVRLWDTVTWGSVAVLKHGVNVYGVAFTPDGTRLACACADGSIRFWDVGTRHEVAELHGHGDYVHQIAFSPDGSRLVSGSGDHSVRLWDALSAQEREGQRRAAD
jgi:WD40 repeat protein